MKEFDDDDIQKTDSEYLDATLKNIFDNLFNQFMDVAICDFENFIKCNLPEFTEDDFDKHLYETRLDEMITAFQNVCTQKGFKLGIDVMRVLENKQPIYNDIEIIAIFK